MGTPIPGARRATGERSEGNPSFGCTRRRWNSFPASGVRPGHADSGNCDRGDGPDGIQSDRFCDAKNGEQQYGRDTRYCY